MPAAVAVVGETVPRAAATVAAVASTRAVGRARGSEAAGGGAERGAGAGRGARAMPGAAGDACAGVGKEPGQLEDSPATSGCRDGIARLNRVLCL